jgi:hypothetical protein
MSAPVLCGWQLERAGWARPLPLAQSPQIVTAARVAHGDVDVDVDVDQGYPQRRSVPAVLPSRSGRAARARGRHRPAGGTGGLTLIAGARRCHGDQC